MGDSNPEALEEVEAVSEEIEAPSTKEEGTYLSGEDTEEAAAVCRIQHVGGVVSSDEDEPVVISLQFTTILQRPIVISLYFHGNLQRNYIDTIVIAL